jgi:hypothetical protein
LVILFITLYTGEYKMKKQFYFLFLVLLAGLLLVAGCSAQEPREVVSADTEEAGSEGPVDRGAGGDHPDDISCNNAAMAPTATTISAADQQTMLSLHNNARGSNVALVWDDNLARLAQGWANAIVEFNNQNKNHILLQGAHSKRSDNTDTCYRRDYGQGLGGENITSGSADVNTAVQLWIDEGPNYNTSSRTCSGVCGHYLQVVGSWVTKVGCGHNAQSSWVCMYDRFGAVQEGGGVYKDPFTLIDLAGLALGCNPFGSAAPAGKPFILCQPLFFYDGEYDPNQWYKGYVRSYSNGSYSVWACDSATNCGSGFSLSEPENSSNLVSLSTAASMGITHGCANKAGGC